MLGLSSVALVYAFVTARLLDQVRPPLLGRLVAALLQITAYWGGLDGSILWWVFLLSVFSAIAVYTNRNRHRELLPYAVDGADGDRGLLPLRHRLPQEPFDTFLTDIPTAGKGLNPLLQNAYMVTHPPSLYTGFVGMSIPFAFGMAALISGQLDDAWIASVRSGRWAPGSSCRWA